MREGRSLVPGRVLKIGLGQRPLPHTKVVLLVVAEDLVPSAFYLMEAGKVEGFQGTPWAPVCPMSTASAGSICSMLFVSAGCGC